MILVRLVGTYKGSLQFIFAASFKPSAQIVCRGKEDLQ